MNPPWNLSKCAFTISVAFYYPIATVPSWNCLKMQLFADYHPVYALQLAFARNVIDDYLLQQKVYFFSWFQNSMNEDDQHKKQWVLDQC